MKPLVVAAFAVWIACGAIRWVTSPPLGHDEARYALSARGRLAGEPRRWVYVPVGMDVLAAPGVLAGDTERTLRVIPALLGLAFLVAAWRVAAELGDATSAGWAVAVLAGASPLSRFQIDLLSDLPSAACLLALLALLIHELRRPPPLRWRVVAAAPLAAVALYIRYGSCLPLAVIAVATLAFAGLRRPFVVALVAFAALVPPSTIHTLRVSAGVPPRGGGLAGYAAHPLLYFGPLAMPLLALALAAGWRERWRLYATLIGIADIVVLGIVTAAQARYVAFGVVLLVAVGAAVARDLGPRLDARVGRVVAAVCLAAIIASWITAIALAVTERTRRCHGMAATLAASAAIARDAHGRRCVVIGPHPKQLEWYSGCRASRFAAGLTYAVHDDTGGRDQPDLTRLAGTPVLHAANVEVIRL
jgi:hypothetical protein